MKSSRMRWAGHVAGMRETRNEYRIYLENMKKRDWFGDLGIVMRIILKWIFQK
jgi:hypothetical protein